MTVAANRIKTNRRTAPADAESGAPRREVGHDTAQRVSRTNHVVELLLEAATDSRQWQIVLDYLRRALNVDAIALSEYHFSTREGKIGPQLGYEPEYVRLYNERYCKDNPWLLVSERYLTSEIIHDDGGISRTRFVATDFYSNWLKPQNLLHRLCGVIERRAEHVVYLELMRGPRREAYTNRDRAFLKALLPCFRIALKSNNYLWQLAILRNMVDSLPVGVIAVDKTGKVLVANQAAIQELDRGRGLLMRGSQLHASAPNTDTRLRTAIIAAAGNAGHPGDTLIVRRGGHLAPIWIVVAPLGRTLRKVVGQEHQVALIFLSLPERLNRPLVTTLKTCYGLTPSEEKLALLIFEGQRLTDAAAHLGVSLNTARTHMKRIYTKTKTKHQSELVRVLLTGPLGPLGSSLADPP
ncbi:MAG: PAS domain-containing protein [Gammaproteobacteria bacterium]